MAKNLIQDIVKPKSKILKKEKEVFYEPPMNNSSAERPTARGPRHALWFVAVIAVVFLVFSISFLLTGAEVTVVPKEKDYTLKSSFDAVKDASGEDLAFDLVVLSGDESKILPASGLKSSTVKATGTVIIYNTYGPASQPLAIDTRLEGSNGKLYKTVKAITVPGMQSKPGSIEVGIYAAEAGPEYNSAPLDFKIFGFKGTPKYEKFYARSKGEISGGYIGQTPQMSETDKASAVAELKGILQEKLLKKANAELPEGFILYKDAVSLNADQAPSFSLSLDNHVSVTLHGTLYGIILNEKNLTKKISEILIDQYDGSEVYIPNIKDLAFMLTSKDTDSLNEAKKISFNLSGNPKIIWRVDEDSLASSLVNSSKKDFNTILSKFPSVASAELTLRPAWKNSFPEKVKDIKVKVNYPK